MNNFNKFFPETFIEIDKKLFLFFNDLNNAFFDVLFSWITWKYTWIPFYLLLLILMFWKYKWNGIAGLIAISLAVAFADQLTSGFMKPFFERLRPCHNTQIRDQVNIVGDCGGRYSFASGHAANSFAVAVFMFFMLKQYFRYMEYLFLWAAIVAYSRIYVGVHYPGDIIAGAIVGTICGGLMYIMYYFFSDFLTGNKTGHGIKNSNSG